jgi:hypothetical protein
MNALIAHESRPTMHEFPEDKCEIYKAQLFRNQKNRKLKELEHEHEQPKAEGGLTDGTLRLSVLGDECKNPTIRIDAVVARKRRMADEAR